MVRIGIFGGSFNPVHLGHKRLAVSAMTELNFERIIVVPAKKPPHKLNLELESDFHRLNMLKLTFDDNRFEVSDFEIKSREISYSIYTVQHFKKLYSDAEIVFLMGTDMLLYFNKWHKFESLLEMMTIGVIARDFGDLEKIELKKAELSKYNAKIEVMNSQPFPISSTEIRSLIKNKQDISCYIDEKVVEYIMENNLYT